MELSTGSTAFDNLIGGGVRGGILLDIFGEAASGKTQTCFTLCANCVLRGERVFFVDTTGTFRPERMVEIAGTEKVLGEINYYRAFSAEEQISVIQKIKEFNPGLVIIDSATSLFSFRYSGAALHLRLMAYLHELAAAASSSGCTFVITNMVRAALPTGNQKKSAEPPAPQNNLLRTRRSVREFLGSSVSLYSHVRIELEIVDPFNSLYHAILHQPSSGMARFSITSHGISDPIG